jgi:hypothetical protein
MSERFEMSKNSGAHNRLHQLEGEWSGIAKTWFEPGEPVDASPVTGTIRPVLGGQFMLHEYKGSFGGKPLEGMAILGFHIDLQQYQCAWIDSFHTGLAIMLSKGEKGELEQMSMLGSYAYVTPETEQHWGWRTSIEFRSDDEVVITAYNISPEGEEAKATEVVYNRKR